MHVECNCYPDDCEDCQYFLVSGGNSEIGMKLFLMYGCVEHDSDEELASWDIVSENREQRTVTIRGDF